MKHYLLTAFLFLFSFPFQAFGQSSTIDFLRNTGKIYSVYAVILVLFLGIVAYLIHLDRKISKIEKKDNQ